MPDTPESTQDAPLGPDGKPKTPPETPPPPNADGERKFEVKDGKMSVDGRPVVYEAELIAAKKSLEGQIESQQAIHVEAIDKAKVEASGALTQVATSNAEVTRLTTELENARKSGGTSDEDVSKLKTDLEAANSRVEAGNTALLDSRKNLLIAKYPGQITAEKLVDKTAVQLDALEEALKAVAGGACPGPYAVDGAGGGTAPMTETDRAKAILDATPVRGVRNQPDQK